jgi:hypothetical protein
MPMTLRARVTKGRLVVDEPTDLPEGTEVELVSIEQAAVETVSRRMPTTTFTEAAADLVGCVSAPRDLSISSKRLAGYGRRGTSWSTRDRWSRS